MKRTLLFVCAAIATFFTLTQQAGAFVQATLNGYAQHWPSGIVTLNILLQCDATQEGDDCVPVPTDIPSSYPEGLPSSYWNDIAEEAARRWSNAGSNFRFDFEPEYIPADPCDRNDGLSTIAWQSTDCQGVSLGSTGTVVAGKTYKTTSSTGEILEADVILNSNLTPELWVLNNLYYVTIHELGHVLGLLHPNDHGQRVASIMNSPITVDRLQDDDYAGIQHIYGEKGGFTQDDNLVGVLENPSEGREVPVSGIGVISGWVCDAENIMIQIRTLRGIVLTQTSAAYGTERRDTRSVCGDIYNGFGLLLNWNGFQPDTYIIIAAADGTEIGRSTVTVTSLGEEFLRGAPKTEYVLENFPEEGKSVVVQWQESLQNFVIVEKQN